MLYMLYEVSNKKNIVIHTVILIYNFIIFNIIIYFLFLNENIYFLKSKFI